MTRPRQVAALVVLLVILVVILATRPSPGRGRTVHDDGRGPLSATSASGGVGINAPRGRRTWSGSFGSLLLCVTGHERVQLERVRIEADPRPLTYSFRLRRVPVGGNMQASEWEPFYSSQGTWPHLHVGPLRGTVGPFGGAIDQPCEGPDGVLHHFTELIVQLKTGPEGARVKRTLIDYRVGDRRYTLRVNWQMVLCGTRTTDTCSQHPGPT